MWRDRLHEDQEGVALIYALFAVVILAGLAVVFVSRAISEARFTRIGRDGEAAIHVAEAGAEAYIAAINEEGDDSLAQRVLTTGVTPDPGPVSGRSWPAPSAGSHFVYDTSVIDTEGAEVAWVLDIAHANPGLVRSTAEGDAFGIRPVLWDESDAAMVIFGVGFVPSYADWKSGDRDTQVRVIKMQIARDNYVPDHALLVGGDLALGGNAAILAPDCVPSDPDPDDCDADVHVNGELDVTGSSHSIDGRVTTTGSITGTPNTVPSGRSSAGEESRPLPAIEARDFYGRDIGDLNPDPGGRAVLAVDLCPTGEVKELSSSPCSGATIWPDGASTTYRGWRFRSGTNTWEARNLDSGFFYVYHADADVTGSAGTGARAVTIVVEGNPSDPTRSGSLSLAGNPTFVAAVPDTLFIADRDVKMKGTSSSGSCASTDPACIQRYTGFIWAGEQLDVSGTVDITGAIIAEDDVDDHGLVTRNTAGVTGTMTLDYDDQLVLDISGIVTIEYWNELD